MFKPVASTSTSSTTPTPTNAAATSSTSTTANATTAKSTANAGPFLSQTSEAASAYPISSTPPAVTNTGPVQWQSAHQGRPTLTGGIPSGRVSGTC